MLVHRENGGLTKSNSWEEAAEKERTRRRVLEGTKDLYLLLWKLFLKEEIEHFSTYSQLQKGSHSFFFQTIP